MTFYDYIKNLVGESDLPMTADNADGEVVLIEQGKNNDCLYFKLTTEQHNGWYRINYYYPDGTIEEFFKREI